MPSNEQKWINGDGTFVILGLEPLSFQAVETNKYVFKLPMFIKRILAATVFNFSSKILKDVATRLDLFVSLMAIEGAWLYTTRLQEMTFD